MYYFISLFVYIKNNIDNCVFVKCKTLCFILLLLVTTKYEVVIQLTIWLVYISKISLLGSFTDEYRWLYINIVDGWFGIVNSHYWYVPLRGSCRRHESQTMRDKRMRTNNSRMSHMITHLSLSFLLLYIVYISLLSFATMEHVVIKEFYIHWFIPYVHIK